MVPTYLGIRIKEVRCIFVWILSTYDSHMQKMQKMASVPIILLFCLNIQFVNSASSDDISCDQKIASKPFYHQEFECRDYSATELRNKTIASCSLFYYGFPMFEFGWNYNKNVENNWVHPIIIEPTDRSCSMKLNLHNDIVATISKFFDQVQGKMQHLNEY